MMDDCAVNLKSLQDFSLLSTWCGELSQMSAEEFDVYLAERGLLWKNRKCPGCLQPRSLTHQIGSYGQEIRLKFECSRKKCRRPGVQRKIGYLRNTFFEHLRDSRKTMFLASVLFVDDLGRLEVRAEHCGVKESTMKQWDQWFRDIIVETFVENETPLRIGGPKKVLQLEEVFISKRKYDRGRAERDSWLVGGVIYDSKEIFVEIASTRNSATLDRIVAKHVRPGTVIQTNSWTGYSNLGNLGYVHQTVRHQPKFTATSAYTESVAWFKIEEMLEEFGLKAALKNDEFLEFVWKWRHDNDSKLYLLWSEIAKRYPLID
ncbi:unnamed protein product [Heligmosomoides polygyrus]|uniref:DDE_Tnp_IS1595 domain-containing protein n=1 Tax=Heligmosomoides polygyrus TaxID=6339 RepID=A0A183GRH4_HELPZ|nr:unnamed protein product [Heligmosomoides polygyrus]